MGCTNQKQSRQQIQINDFDFPDIKEIIHSIQNIISQLEQYYSDVVSSNKSIPEKAAMLSPADLIKLLRKTSLLDNTSINQIEKDFLVLFTDLAKVITEAYTFLLDSKKNSLIPQKKKNVLLAFILLYEKTCNQFFSYMKETDSKRLAQEQLDIQQKLLKIQEKHLLRSRCESNLSVNLSTQESQAKII